MSRGPEEPKEPPVDRDPYAPPASMIPPEAPPAGKDYGCRGAAIGGCLVPFVGLLVTAAMGDAGGPLFWPMIGVPLAIGGMALGSCFPRRARPAPPPGE